MVGVLLVSSPRHPNKFTPHFENPTIPPPKAIQTNTQKPGGPNFESQKAPHSEDPTPGGPKREALWRASGAMGALWDRLTALAPAERAARGPGGFEANQPEHPKRRPGGGLGAREG